MSVGSLSGGSVSNVSKGSNVANIGGAIAGQVFGAVITSAFAKADAKKQRQLEEELAKLDLAQQKELAERMQNVEGEVAKQKAYYEYLAEQNNNEMLNKLKSKRYTSFIVLGAGVILLAFVVLGLKKKKNG
jgi:guanylate kinase